MSTWAELDRAQDIFWINSNNGTFIVLQMKSFGSKKKSNYMQGLKRAIWAIFQTESGRPGQGHVNTALKNPLLDFKNYCFYEFLAMPEGKVRKGSFIW